MISSRRKEKLFIFPVAAIKFIVQLGLYVYVHDRIMTFKGEKWYYNLLNNSNLRLVSFLFWSIRTATYKKTLLSRIKKHSEIPRAHSTGNLSILFPYKYGVKIMRTEATKVHFQFDNTCFTVTSSNISTLLHTLTSFLDKIPSDGLDSYCRFAITFLFNGH